MNSIRNRAVISAYPTTTSYYKQVTILKLDLIQETKVVYGPCVVKMGLNVCADSENHHQTAPTQSDQGHNCPLAESFNIADPLRKRAYANTCILKISPPKTEIFQIKILIFYISAQKHILWVLVRGGSNEYPQYMFLSRNKKKECIAL